MTWALLIALAAAAQQAVPSHAREVPAPGPRVVAVVNGTKLLSDWLDATVGSLLPLESFHRNVSAEKIADLRRHALTQIVDDELQYQDAVARGLAVSSAAVDKALAEAAAHYPSRQALTAALAGAGATIADMRRELRRTLMIRRAYEQRVTDRCVVDRPAAQQYFDEHPDRFVEPERLRIQAITIGVDPSGGEKAWATGRTRAEDVRRQLMAGASFDAMANTYSTDPSAPKGGDMGLLHRGSLSQAFESVVSTLPVGEASQVVETIYGYHVIKVTEVLPPRPLSFADVGARVQQDLTAERCDATRASWLASLRAAAAIAYPQ